MLEVLHKQGPRLRHRGGLWNHEASPDHEDRHEQGCHGIERDVVLHGVRCVPPEHYLQLLEGLSHFDVWRERDYSLPEPVPRAAVLDARDCLLESLLASPRANPASPSPTCLP